MLKNKNNNLFFPYYQGSKSIKDKEPIDLQNAIANIVDTILIKGTYSGAITINKDRIITNKRCYL